MSVQRIGSSIVSLNATCAISRARLTIVSAGTPHSAATALGRVARIEVAFGGERQHGRRRGRPSGSVHDPNSAGRMSAPDGVGEVLRCLVEHQRLPAPSRANRPSSAVPGACTTSHGALVWRDRNAKSIVPSVQQHVDDRQREQAVGARPHRNPLVGDRRVAGAHRVDRYELRAAALQLLEADLDRIGRVVFGHAPQHEVLREVEVGRRRTPRTSSRSCTGPRPPC